MVNKKIKKSEKKSYKGLLLKDSSEKIPSDVFELLREELKDRIKGCSGLYALYKDDKLYYVGLTKNLDGRIFGHLEKDKHAGKWNKFSVFLVKKTNYLKDLETLVLRISKPSGNKLTGELPGHHVLRRELKTLAQKLRKRSGVIGKALR